MSGLIMKTVLTTSRCASLLLHCRRLRGGTGWSQVAAATTSLLHTSRPHQDIFTVQDEADFKMKVEQSKKPVIVQFHAS
jgi:hypothetical protein